MSLREPGEIAALARHRRRSDAASGQRLGFLDPEEAVDPVHDDPEDGDGETCHFGDGRGGRGEGEEKCVELS